MKYKTMKFDVMNDYFNLVIYRNNQKECDTQGIKMSLKTFRKLYNKTKHIKKSSEIEILFPTPFIDKKLKYRSYRGIGEA